MTTTLSQHIQRLPTELILQIQDTLLTQATASVALTPGSTTKEAADAYVKTGVNLALVSFTWLRHIHEDAKRAHRVALNAYWSALLKWIAWKPGHGFDYEQWVAQMNRRTAGCDEAWLQKRACERLQRKLEGVVTARDMDGETLMTVIFGRGWNMGS